MSSADKVEIMEQLEASSSSKSPLRRHEDPEDESQDDSSPKRSWMNSTAKGKGSIGLKTASGKKVPVSKSALLKAKLLFSSIDGEGANNNVTLSSGWSNKGKAQLGEEDDEENKENINVVRVSNTQGKKCPLTPVPLLKNNGGGVGKKKRFVPPFLVQAANTINEIVATARDKPDPFPNKAKGTQEQGQKASSSRVLQVSNQPMKSIVSQAVAVATNASSLLEEEEIAACTDAFLLDDDEDWF